MIDPASLPRSKKRLILIMIDASIAPIALWVAFVLRMEEIFPRYLAESIWLIPLAPLLLVGAYASQGMYSAVTRYLDAGFSLTILKSSIFYLFLFTSAAVMTQATVPRSVYILNMVLAGVITGGVRIGLRMYLPRHVTPTDQSKRIAIFGAGRAGVQVAKALQESPEYNPVAYFDDARDKAGTSIMGIRVFAPAEISRIIERKRVDQIVLCIPSASKIRRAQIIESLMELNVEVKTLPGVDQLMTNEINLSDIREVDITELLGRDPVPPITELLDANIRGKTILVSGAGGSIGSEMCRQIIQQDPHRLILLEQSEYALYQIDRELRLEAEHRDVILKPIINNLCCPESLEEIMRSHKVDTVYHAAAYKHVPLVQCNILEGIRNNVFGTVNLARSAMACKVSNFILISTDKAVRPTSVMGMTKRMSEMVLQALNEESHSTCFAMVRFGNVLGSSGSVIPLFRKQIRDGGPITLTHPDVTRYFMTIPEAAQLVIQAGAMARGGDLFLLDMGASVKIADLARNMVQLSGLTIKSDENPDGDVEIVVTGLRPGEKLYEELLIDNDAEATRHPKIMRAQESFLSWQRMTTILEEMRLFIDVRNSNDAEQLLKQSVSFGNNHVMPTVEETVKRVAV